MLANKIYYKEEAISVSNCTADENTEQTVENLLRKWVKDSPTNTKALTAKLIQQASTNKNLTSLLLDAKNIADLDEKLSTLPPGILNQLAHIKTLDLSNYTIPTLAEFPPQIKELNISGNPLYHLQNFPESIGKLTAKDYELSTLPNTHHNQITELDVSNNKLNALPGLANAKVILANNNCLSGKCIAPLSTEILNIANNTINPRPELRMPTTEAINNCRQSFNPVRRYPIKKIHAPIPAFGLEIICQEVKCIKNLPSPFFDRGRGRRRIILCLHRATQPRQRAHQVYSPPTAARLFAAKISGITPDKISELCKLPHKS